MVGSTITALIPICLFVIRLVALCTLRRLRENKAKRAMPTALGGHVWTIAGETCPPKAVGMAPLGIY